MRKKPYLILGIIFTLLSLTWQNAVAMTPIEKKISTKGSALYYYDPILNTIYQTLKKVLPAEQFQALKIQQIEWLKQLKTYDADTQYAKRLSELSIHYKDYLQPYYLNALAEGKLSPNLLHAFMWFFYSDYDMSETYSFDLKEEGGGAPGMLDLQSKFSILKLSPDQFIIAGQFNDIGEITNSDGGVFSFYLVQPSKNKITPFNIQDTDCSYDSTLQVTRVASMDPAKKQMVLANYDGTTQLYSINVEKMRLDLKYCSSTSGDA